MLGGGLNRETLRELRDFKRFFFEEILILCVSSVSSLVRLEIHVMLGNELKRNPKLAFPARSPGGVMSTMII